MKFLLLLFRFGFLTEEPSGDVTTEWRSSDLIFWRLEDETVQFLSLMLDQNINNDQILQPATLP